MLLALDSATAACSAALLAADGTVLARAHEVVGRGHAERLVPMIAGLLDGRRPEAVLAGCGPGSFTGLRVGLAAAHGLAIGWGVPLSGFSTLALIAAGIERAPEEAVAVAMEGGHGALFVQSFGHDPLEPLDDLRSLPPEEAAAVIAAPRVFGTGAARLVAARGGGVASDALPDAAHALRLPERLRALPPRPIYGRAPDARPGGTPS